MVKIDRVKSIISLLEKILLAFIIALFGMISYIVINIYKLTYFQIGITIIGILITLVILFFLIRVYFKKLKELEDL
ncbi:hypothetical protein BKH41_08845 [Helicobacter sp. 12S02232-10]|nr:hypothetical protein BKH41_08845 [Helicobacter sp. 12S02232-10]